MRARRALVALLGVGLACAGTSQALGAGGYRPFTNPRAAITPVPDIFATAPNACFSDGFSSKACELFVASAIDHARALEGVRPLALPRNWLSLTASQQVFVVVNLERVDRGYPPYLGINAALSADAQRTAHTHTYSALTGFPLASASRGEATYFRGTAFTMPSALYADYILMYNSLFLQSGAPRGCTSDAALACWEVRDGLMGWSTALEPGVGQGCRTCEVGVATTVLSPTYQLTVYYVARPQRTPPPLTFTWSREKRFLSPAPGPTTSTIATTTTTPATTTTSGTTPLAMSGPASP